MSQHRHERLVSSLQRLTAEFLRRQAGAQSLITVTGLELSDDGKRATILLSIFPDNKEAAALDFANRQAGELRAYIKANLSSRELPRFEFVLDEGEKHRRKVEELLK